MVKIKQVAKKRPINNASSDFDLLTPHKKAIKSASNLRSDVATRSARKSLRPALKKVSDVQTIARIVKKAPRFFQRAEEEEEEEAEDSQRATASQLQRSQKSRFALFSLPKRTFQGLCKVYSHKYLPDSRWTKEGLEALQWALEDFMVGFFDDAKAAMLHGNRKTLQLKDIELVKRFRKIDYTPL